MQFPWFAAFVPRMKSLQLFVCLLSLTALHAHCQGADAEAMSADATTELTRFYVLYCHALSTNGNLLAHPDKLKPYVSVRFLKELARLGKIEGGIEADPFVCAQDTDPAWEKNVKVAHAKASDDGKTARADVTLGGTKEMVRHLKVALVDEGGVYKVDRVKDADLKP